MLYKVIISFFIFNILYFNVLSQVEFNNNFDLEWGTLERSPGSLLEILPQNNADFYSLRWSGGRAFGTYRIVEHQNLQQVNQGRIKQVAQSGIANFETAYYVGERLYVFLSDKVNGELVLYAQPFSQELTPDGSSVVIAKYNNDKMNAKPNFGVISSENKEYIGIVWEIPGRKTISDAYGYVILDQYLNKLNQGAYNIPLNGNLTSINEHHISNAGDYFLSLTEHKRPNDRIFSKDYDNFKALHVYKIKDNALTEFSLSIDDKRIDDLKMSSNDDGIFTLSGVYGSSEIKQNRRKHLVDGIFVIRIDTDVDSMIFQGFIPFRKDFISMNFNEKSTLRSRRKRNREQELYNYKIRDLFTLSDGSLVGSIEQYYIFERSSYDSRTGLTSTIYYYYYDDIIAFKIGNDKAFDWQKKINKSQISTNDGGPFSSYSSFTDGRKLYFIFNDNLKNYNEEGKFIQNNRECFPFNLSRRKNIAAITAVDLASGALDRNMLFSRKELKSIVVPKMFKLDQLQNRLLLYALLGGKERFGILKFDN